MIYLSGILIISGSLLVLISSIGLLRMPDFYTRIHAAGKTDTLGQILVMSGIMLYSGFSLVSLKVLFILAFILITSPTSTHALVYTAYQMGVKWWSKKNDNID